MTKPGEKKSDELWRAALRDMDRLLEAASEEWPASAPSAEAEEAQAEEIIALARDNGRRLRDTGRLPQDSGRLREDSGPSADLRPQAELVGSPPPRTRYTYLLWLLAPAAVVASLFIGSGDPAPPVLSPAPVTASLEVEAPGPFIVLETDNPRIAVVWLLEETS